MRICNRKLATRIVESEAALIKLVTERQFDSTANQQDVKEAIVMFRNRIQQDENTLRVNGFTRNGDRHESSTTNS
jgi:hypothetical protein